MDKSLAFVPIWRMVVELCPEVDPMDTMHEAIDTAFTFTVRARLIGALVTLAGFLSVLVTLT